MQIRAVRALAPLVVCGVALFAADVWKTKDPSAWTSEDVQKVLTDSPWAKAVAVKMEGSGQGGGMGRGGGGTWGGGGGGMGGGMGMPRIGGLSIPGGGMGGGRRGGGRRPQESLNATIRWDSAAPIKQALLKSEPASEEKDAAKTPDPAAKSYIISVTGLPTGMRRSSSGNGDDDANNGGQRRRERDPDAVREELMESTHLTPKGKRTLVPSDVKFDIQGGRHEIEFFFPREAEIDRDDKEVTFETQLGRIKLEKKFNLKDMVFQGKLAL
ncbi:MAG: hypothetical protein ACRD9L_10575 [Bryobacteraceae bacterium]